ncbi:endonuclease/exonuclease/phosphatase family protein [Dysgonomonas sp. 511]|uniref:endonuclease/exonuclease/phosphatase family protein n=1 Tax=Dysgonomonas sp. 511 TaxID=2302930 RepID=UPI0013D3EC48|nr:endonuclease/exonuclease/phosphatase family protein [Dysgonomonas sp. 511]NDV78730.1 endonuclease/exonuclease/phosphatase family protein [Dysgonomonas sp. 511]
MNKKTIYLLLLSLLCAAGAMSQTTQKHPLKLRIGTYNVGHFNQGKLGGYQGEDVQEELQRWRNWISAQSMDIFIVNEWNSKFDKGGTVDATETLLKPLYNNVYFGDENKWIYNGIATNYELTNIRQVTWHADYYALVADLKIGKKIITIMSTHIPWKKEHHPKAINDMIAEMKKYEYLICMGDMNAPDATQLRFQEEGFNIANGGYQGFMCTAPGSKAKGRTKDISIDNIFTSKNIKILNASAPSAGLTEQDHYPVLADVIITW